MSICDCQRLIEIVEVSLNALRMQINCPDLKGGDEALLQAVSSRLGLELLYPLSNRMIYISIGCFV